MQSMVNQKGKVLVTGARGMLGSSVVRALERQSSFEVLGGTRDSVNLRNPAETPILIHLGSKSKPLVNYRDSRAPMRKFHLGNF